MNTRLYFKGERLLRDTERKEPEHLLSDARALLRDGESGKAWTIIERLWARAKPQARRGLLRCAVPPHPHEEILDDFRVDCFIHWLDLSPKAAFWEVKFRLCLSRALMDRLDKQRRRRVLLMDEVWWGKQVAPQTDFFVDDLTEQLPPRVRYAVKRLAEGYSEEAIGRALGCTDRTVRNYRKRAAQMLEEAEA